MFHGKKKEKKNYFYIKYYVRCKNYADLKYQYIFYKGISFPKGNLSMENWVFQLKY